MPKFEVFHPAAPEKKEPQPSREPRAAQSRPVRVAVWQGGRLVECFPRKRPGK